MHDEEVGVVDVELHALEEVLHLLLRRAMPTDEVLALTIDRDLRERARTNRQSEATVAQRQVDERRDALGE